MEADGWPLHIVSFAEPAAHVSRKHNGQLTDRGLAAVVEFGRDRMERYYRRRASEIAASDIALLGAAIQFRGRRARWERKELIRAFDLIDRVEAVTGADVVDTMVSKGVLASELQIYHVPIPSMEDWLITFFEQYRLEWTTEATQIRQHMADIFEPQQRQLRTRRDAQNDQALEL